MILTPSLGSTLTLKIPCSTKPAPLFCGFFVRTRQHCLFPVLAVVFPHPLQNRVPRVQVLLPLPKTGENTGFSPVFFLHVLHGFGVHLGSDTGFSHLVLSVSNRSHPLQHPKRTRFRLFRAESGAFRSFDPQNFSHLFCSLCRYGSQVEIIGDPTQPGGVLFDVVQLG